MIPKIKRWEDKKYREWVATLHCANCNIKDETIVGHHLAHILAPHCGGGGQKAADYLSMPLCYVCHNKLHTEGDTVLLAHQVTMILNTLRLAFHYGKLQEGK